MDGVFLNCILGPPGIYFPIAIELSACIIHDR